MKSKLFFLALWAFHPACRNSTDQETRHSHSYQGSEQFQAMLAQGAGRLRPQKIQSKSALGLSQRDIHTIKVDAASGAWSWVGFDTQLGQAYPADADLLAIAKEFIVRYESELGFSPDEILVQDGAIQSPYPSTRLITLQRQHQGTPIKGAFINLFFSLGDDGDLRLSEIVNNSYGAISIKSSAAPMPSNAAAITASGISDLTVEAKQPYIQPVLDEDGRYEFVYASEFQLKNPSTGETFYMTLDNITRDIHEAHSSHVYATHQVSVQTFPRSYIFKDVLQVPIRFARARDGEQNLATDKDGTLEANGNEISLELTNLSNRTSVFDAANPQVPVSFPVTLDPSGKTLIIPRAPDLPAVNVYVAVQETLAFVSKHLSAKEMSALENGFDANVNLDDSCNAFYNGSSINFFKGSDRCGNTALVSDAVKHEWGHGLDDFLGPNSRSSNGRRGVTDSSYSEGIGDILASYESRSPNLAPGFFLNSTQPLRVVKNNRTHPPANAREAEVHSAGLIIAGAFWDLHENLSSLYGADRGNELASRLFLRHLISSDRYVDAYRAVLRVDDDDSNTATQSPNYCAITKAFAKHNVADGENAGANCFDRDPSVRVKIETVDEGVLGVLVSAWSAAKILACPGDVASCREGDAGFIEFAGSDGDDRLTRKGERKFYKAQGTLNAGVNPSYTFFSVDAQNQVMAKRVLTFKSEGPAPLAL